MSAAEVGMSEALVEKVADIVHGFRCGEKCWSPPGQEHVGLARAVLAAMLPDLVARPVVDRDALADYFHDEGYCRPWEDHYLCDCRTRALSVLINGPVRDADDVRRQVAEEIAAAIEAHEARYPHAPGDWAMGMAKAARLARDFAGTAHPRSP